MLPACCASEEQTLWPGASHARPRTAGSTTVIRQQVGEWGASFPLEAHIYKINHGSCVQLCPIEIPFSHRIAWELTVLLGLIWQLHKMA
jgi:hypothetical protein